MLVGGKAGRDFEEGAHAVEFGAPARVQPAEATHAMEAAGEHVLEEAAEELEGFQVNMAPGAGGAVAEGPAQAATGQELELAVAGGGLEHVLAGDDQSAQT